MALKLAEAFVRIGADESRFTAALKGVRARLEGMKAKLEEFGRIARRAFTVGAIATGFAVKAAISAERGYAEVRKTTGLAGEEFEKLKQSINGLAATMGGISLEQLQSMAATAGQLGIRGVENITAFAKSFAKLTVVSDISEESANDVARLLNILGEAPTELEKVGAVMNELSNRTSATAGDILELARRFAGAGKTVGLTTDQVLGLAAGVRDAGASLEVGGATMTQVLLKMTKDTEKFAGAIRVNFDQFAALVRTKPVEALRVIIDRIGQMDKVAATEALNNLGLDGIRAAGTLLQMAQATEKVEKSLQIANEEIQKGSSLQKEYATFSATTSAELQRLWNNIKLTGIALTESLLPVIKQAAGFFSEFAMSVRDSMDDSTSGVSRFVDFVRNSFETIGVVLRNWADIWELAKINMAESLLNMLQRLKAFWQTTKDFLAWFARNWVDVFKTAFNFIGSLFWNLSQNFANLVDAIAHFMKTGNWEFTFQPLLEGFESALQELPEIAKAELISMDEERKKVLDRIAKREQKRLNDMAKRRKKAMEELPREFKVPERERIEGAAQQKKKEEEKERKGLELVGLQEFAQRIQEAVGTKKGKVEEEQLAVQKKIEEHAAQMASGLAAGIVPRLGA